MASVDPGSDKSADLGRHVCDQHPAGTVNVVRMSPLDRTLLLLRHAKSDYPDGVPDHERPLASRGVREAGLAGDWIRANVPAVDAVLCSTATRTRQTLARTGLDRDGANTRYSEDLYDSRPSTVLNLIKGTREDIDTLLVIGHEPTMSGLAAALAGPTTDVSLREEIATKYPTSAIAVLQIELPWDQLGLGRATLVDFHVPR